MKNKSTRHKDANTFKFVPFTERIANINIDVYHKVGHEYEDQVEENQSHFYQAIENWSILNLTESFDEFKKELKPKTVITLPQLVLEKERVIEVLLKHLKLKNLLSLQALLDIVSALAKDLQKDLYKYYKSFFDVLIDLLSTNDTELLEWTFTCLAHLFKRLWRYFLKDIHIVFNRLLPLLSSNKPEYINNFAAGSFAFVARKVKNWPSFLSHILETVTSRKDGIEGCGKLFFEVVHGVSGQFHSCATTILPFLLESLSDSQFPQKTLFEILEQVIDNIVSNIQPQHGDLLWNSLLSRLSILEIKWKDSQNEETTKEIELILKLLGQSIEYRKGKFLHMPQLVVEKIMKLLTIENLSESVLLLVSQLVILLLVSKNVNLTQEQASGIIKKALNLTQENILLYFVDNITEFSSFEGLILPEFLRRFKNNLNDNFLKVLTHLILKKSPISQSGINLPKWKKYSISFNDTDSNLRIENVFLDHLSMMENFENYFSSLICLPHLNLHETEKVVDNINQNVFEILLKLEQQNDSKSEIKKMLFLLNQSVECLVHLNHTQKLNEKFELFLESLLQLSLKEEYICALKTLDLLITVFSRDDSIVNMSILIKLNSVLAQNFNSPYHEVRLYTSHLYTFFESLPQFDLRHSEDPDIPSEKFQVFTICYRVESIDSQVDTYRDQVKNLDKFLFDKPQMIMCKQTDFKTIPLRYLCGTLYINFKLLWEPVMKIIETHAHGLEINEFWGIYGEELKNVVRSIREKSEPETDIVPVKWEFFGDLYQEVQKLKSKPDFVNYRLLLWKAMTTFADTAEVKTRDTSELFLDFIEKEYTRNNSDIALTWNIKENSTAEAVEEAVDEKIEETNEETAPKTKQKGGKANLRALLTFLSVFAKIRSPMSMYREPELNKLYLDFLQHKNHEIQKAALDCIVTYKYKYIMPYKDNLYNLIDDKNFKNEVIAFRIDKESDSVQVEHRENLIPLIMKIVFSKMTAKTGLRTGTKSSGQFRRNLIFRFLAGCEHEEMLAFVKMAFRYYTKHLDEDPEVMVDNVIKGTSLENFVPPKRLQSALNLLNVILEQFGGLMGHELLTFVLQIVFIIGAKLKGALDQISNIHAGYLPIFRILRTSSIKIIERFFGQFDRYPWTNKQINTVFKVFVWPYLSKLNIEGIHSPTALLKLFVQWGSNPRYFPLLVKHKEGEESNFVLPRVVELLLNQKSHVSVTKVIEEMIEKLLKLQPNDEDVKLAIPVDNLLPVAENILDRIKIDDKLNYGSCILLPHVPSILLKMKQKLEGKIKHLNQKELFILSRISELVWEAEISDSTLKLLLPVILKRCSGSIGEEVVTQFLTTVSNLVSNVDDPCTHLKHITALFGVVTYPSGRKLLVQTLKRACNGNKELDLACDLVDGLNSWNSRWIDQPDFERRHNTFKELKTYIEKDQISLELGMLIIYNCFYLLKNEEDLSLRENSSHTLKLLCPQFLNKYKKEVDYILSETIFELIRKGMKSKDYDFRNYCISLLGHLARECPESHVVLRDLSRYTNKVDLEVDFFENITSLQLHRQGRALLKFCQITRELTNSPNIRTLTQFVLPFASFYLCNEKYVGKNSVIDGAIECIGTVCRILPWHQYEGCLKFYLNELRKKVDYQKQLVRVMVTILDSFHFDLSKAQLIESKLEEGDMESAEKTEEEETIQKSGEEPHQEIDEVVDDKVEDENEEPEESNKEVKITEKIKVLCKSTATRVTRTIQMELLPQLHRSLAEMTQYDTTHKINRKKTSFEREEEDLLRVPISLALVKLLQRLPQEILEVNLPGIFMKLCTFLKSQLDSVRRVTRETLQKMMQTLGPKYLDLLLGVMTPLLNRGYQVHVLVYTTHAVLNCLKDHFKPGDIDKVLLTVIQLCQTDLFGSLSEEKEVIKIAVKTSEAKSTKSFDTFKILSQYITGRCLLDLILPIKNVLLSSHSHKTVYKAEECLRHVALGLVDNNFIETESLIKFAYGIASERIPELIASVQKPVLEEKERELLQRQRPDCFIIPKPPVGRSGVRVNNVKSSAKTNAHILIEFGLRLCFVLLKRDKLKEDEFKPFLDPFVVIFKDCLNSKHIKLSSLTLQCLSWVLKYDLPSMKEHVTEIAKDMFAILHKYASAGLSKGDNFDLVVAAFKAMSVLVRDVKYYTIDIEQLKILLLYTEQDMHDYDRQATAFNLLKAIISRKLIISEIHDVMMKVAELSITSELTHVRAQSRAVFHQYFMDYPLGGKLEQYISFYLSQLDYELQYGRESAIEMISTLISSLPMKILKKYSGTFLITVGASLVNDEAPECRKMVADALIVMLNRLPKKDREPLLDVIYLWLRDKKVSHRRLAAQLCGLFVTVEKSSFEARLKKVAPLILKQFGLGDKKSKSEEDAEDEENQRIRDHHLFQVLQLLLKICSHCPSFPKKPEIEDFAKHVQALLSYPHDWVRLAAAQFIGFVLAGTDIEELSNLILSNETKETGYLQRDPVNSVKSLTLDLCDQLKPGCIKTDLAEQVVKNLVFIARVLQKIPVNDDNKKINLLWLTKRVRKIVNTEVVETPTETVLRTEVFKWIAGVVTLLETENILPILNHLLAPLVREMITTDEKNAPLRQLSKEVANHLKKKVGMEVYTSALSNLQQNLSVKRAERKRVRNQFAVTNPEVFAKKKIKRHERKKEAKKRKLEEMKSGGKKNFKRRKVVSLESME